MQAMEAKERCAKAIADGRYATELDWCRAVAASDDARVPQEWKIWAMERLAEHVPMILATGRMS